MTLYVTILEPFKLHLTRKKQSHDFILAKASLHKEEQAMVVYRLTSNKISGYRGESESEKTTCQDVTRART